MLLKCFNTFIQDKNTNILTRALTQLEKKRVTKSSKITNQNVALKKRNVTLTNHNATLVVIINFHWLKRFHSTFCCHTRQSSGQVSTKKDKETEKDSSRQRWLLHLLRQDWTISKGHKQREAKKKRWMMKTSRRWSDPITTTKIRQRK